MDANQLQSDIAYVRDTVNRVGPARAPASIPLLWAAITAVGFPLADFAPARVGLFWMIAGPAGFIASALLGWRDARQRGQLNRVEGARWSAHWASLLLAIFLAVLLLESGQLTQKGFEALILLLLALVYFLAGVHLERRMLWIAPVAAGAYVVVLFITGYVWSIVGAVLAIALVGTALLGGPKRAVAV
jgi:hypothetical protein